MAEELYGYVGTLLRVDLTNNKIEKQPITDYNLDLFIGGRGLGSYIHFMECPPEAGAFDPENVLTFLTGPVTATMLDGGRTMVQGVSPVGYPETGTFTRSSFGGAFAPELKYAGYDGIIIKGKAPRPVYLWIKDDEVEIRDAGMLWGLDNFATQNELWARHGKKTRIASIGPAGEHLCMHATILTDDSSVTGMGSLGATMGSKNLKAIAVQGTGSVRVKDPEGMIKLVEHTQDIMCRKLYNEEGDDPNSLLGSYIGVLPMKDSDLFKESQQENSKVRFGYSSCYSCPLGGCGYSVGFKDGFRPGMGNLKCTEAIAVGPESEANNEYIGRAHFARLNLQERLGFSDSTMWWAGLEPMYAGGLLTEENTGMDWSKIGTIEFTEDLLLSIAYRSTPVGDAIAKGWRYFCEDFIGTPEAIYHYRAIRGIRKSSKHNGGGCCGWYLPGAYLIPGFIRHATSNMASVDIRCPGGDTFLYFSVNPKYMESYSPEYWKLVDDNSKTLFGNEQVVRDVINWNWDSPYTIQFVRWSNAFKCMEDSLVFCYIAFDQVGSYSNYTENHQGDYELNYKLYKIVTGKDMDAEIEDEFGQRIYMLERSILMRQGLTREDDQLFDEVYEEYAEDNVEKSHYGIATGLTKERFDHIMDQFYPGMGMDPETGYPLRETYEKYGLTEIADKLEKDYGIKLK